MSTPQESITGGNGGPPPALSARVFGGNKYTIEQVAWALRRNAGLVMPTAKTLQCSIRTVHAYLDRYPELRQVKQDSRKKITALAETKLIEKVKSGENWAVTLWLKTQAGYSEKNVTEITGANGGPIQVEASVDIKIQHDIVAGMLRGHLENGYALADAMKHMVSMGLPKEALKLLTRADLELHDNGSGTYEVLPEEHTGNGDGAA